MLEHSSVCQARTHADHASIAVDSLKLTINGHYTNVAACHCIRYSLPRAGFDHVSLSWPPEAQLAQVPPPCGTAATDAAEPLAAAVKQMNCSHWLRLSIIDALGEVPSPGSSPAADRDSKQRPRDSACPRGPVSDGSGSHEGDYVAVPGRACPPAAASLWRRLPKHHSAAWRHLNSWRLTAVRSAAATRHSVVPATKGTTVAGARQSVAAESDQQRDCNSPVDVAEGHIIALRQLLRSSTAMTSHAAGFAFGVLLLAKRSIVTKFLIKFINRTAWSFVQPQV